MDKKIIIGGGVVLAVAVFMIYRHKPAATDSGQVSIGSAAPLMSDPGLSPFSSGSTVSTDNSGTSVTPPDTSATQLAMGQLQVGLGKYVSSNDALSHISDNLSIGETASITNDGNGAAILSLTANDSYAMTHPNTATPATYGVPSDAMTFLQKTYASFGRTEVDQAGAQYWYGRMLGGETQGQLYTDIVTAAANSTNPQYAAQEKSAQNIIAGLTTAKT